MGEWGRVRNVRSQRNVRQFPKAGPDCSKADKR